MKTQVIANMLRLVCYLFPPCQSLLRS